jgi:AI-2 transport protein TqsA
LLSDRERSLQTVCLMILTVIAGGGALYWLRPVLIPFILALFFSVALSPVVEFQKGKLHFPTALAVLSTLAMLFLALTLVAGVVSSSVGQITANAAAYQDQITQTLNLLEESLPLERMGFETADEGFDLLSMASSKTAGELLIGTTNAILDVLSQGIVVMIFTAFLLFGGAVSMGSQDPMRGEIQARVKRYLLSQTAISAATGSLVWLILRLLDVDLAAVFGLFAFLLNFIPSIGSIIATLLPVPVVLVSPQLSTTAAILAIALPGALQFMIGNFIAPKVVGDALDLHPVSVLLALMFWGALWGIVGMLLAVPITAVLKILVDRFDVTAPVSQFLTRSSAAAD